MSTSTQLAAIVLLLTQLAGSAQAQAQAKEGSGEGQLQYPIGKIPLFPNSTRIRVCGSPWTPAVECDVDSSAPGRKQWETASGYEIEVFKLMMPVLGWTDEMIDFKCLGWSEMLDELAANETSCDIAPSGLGPMLDRMEKGIIFSDPTIQSGLSVMMVSQGSMYGSVELNDCRTCGRTPTLSLALRASLVRQDEEHLVLLLRDVLGSLGCAARDWYRRWVLISTDVRSLIARPDSLARATRYARSPAGFVVWLMEVGSKSLTMDTRDFSVVVWDTFGRPVQMRDYRLASVAGNTVGWVWSFLAFIVMSLYNAALTANMTIEQLSALPRRMSDLATLSVGSWVDYNETLLQYGINVVPFPWESEEDEQVMLDALVSGEIDALVLDETALRILDANNCSTVLLEGIPPIQVLGQTTAFAKGTPGTVVDEYNRWVDDLDRRALAHRAP